MVLLSLYYSIQGPVCALARSNDLIFSASADCTIKVSILRESTVLFVCSLTNHASCNCAPISSLEVGSVVMKCMLVREKLEASN